ncbi:lysozyme [Novosphingobium sp. BL-8H]|uniref:lysozyme n=1 Tax=Novosphingobium sp. BL-8H TaxID=3127640 RepID=UPI0037575B6E
MTNPRKPIFDALRIALGGKLGADDVTIMDNTLDRLGVPKETILQLSATGEALIKKWEGYKKDLGDGRVQSYPDPATGGAPWTIGNGLTGPDIVKGTIWTHAKAAQRFTQHIEDEAAPAVRKGIGTAATTQAQFDAMVSLAYNIGVGAFLSSTLLKKHVAGDYAAAASQFAVWNKAGGKVKQGLIDRRADEAKLYRGQA